FIMWLGEQITERGIGNGMSLIIFAGIVVNFPRAVIATFDQLRTGQLGLITLLLLVIMMVGVIGAIIYVERGHRRITVQYAKRVVGRRQYGGSSTHIPLKVNTGGVIPVIFASSILTFPQTLSGLATPGSWADSAIRQIAYGMPLYNLLYVLGIIFFAYFYTAIIFNPDDVAKLINANKDVVCGAYPQKWLNIEKLQTGKPIEVCTKSSCHVLDVETNECEYVTTGFLLIKREVFLKMIEEYPDRKYVNDIDGYMGASTDAFYDFFPVSVHPETKKYESEDYGFSRLWRQTGGKLYVVPDITLKHYGWFGFPGNLERQLTDK
ncbi:hypothetical protein EBT31_22365, partial [bacterium]|nr:hypothetical protein [bacterium]